MKKKKKEGTRNYVQVGKGEHKYRWNQEFKHLDKNRYIPLKGNKFDPEIKNLSCSHNIQNLDGFTIKFY